jgi:hypothetical protein
MRFVWMFVIACGSPTPGPTTPTATAPPVGATAPTAPAITVAMTKRGGGVIAAGATVATGDLVELWVTPNQAGYIYIVQFFADGTYDLLFPSGGVAVQAAAAQRIRVPQNPKGWLKVTGDAGEEHVHVLFTASPLATISPALANGLGLAVDTRVKSTPPPVEPVAPDPVPPKPAPQPASPTKASRTYATKAGSASKKPLVMTYDRGSKSLQEIVIDDQPVTFTPASGIVVQTFWYVHAP